MAGSTPWLDDEQQQVWQDLLTVVIALPSLLDRQLERDAGISNFEYSVLARLSMARGEMMRLSDLAAVCDCTLPRLSKAMLRLEQHGWAGRHPDPDDGRYTRGVLTDAGRDKVRDSAPGHVEHVRRLVFDPLSRAQQAQLGAALARIVGPMRDHLQG